MPETITLTAADAGVSRDAAVGQKVVLQLNENPTTGYRWALDATPPKAIENLVSQYVATPGGAIGGGGKREFSFTTSAPGEIHLRLKLWREWQGEDSATQRYEFTLKVR